MATPEDNAVKIETVKGDLKALEQKVEGSLKQQAENGRRIDENVSEIKTKSPAIPVTVAWPVIATD